ncbi:MAG: RnfABCDGE type electron transport complex subunit B [Sulfurifustis sp.]
MPFAVHDPTLVARLDACLPQTQCTRCGYPRCHAYAGAIARGEADINQCPPGGETTLNDLARVLGVATKPLDVRYGVHQGRRRAVIDESRCIGCAKCLEACPVDAIVGAPKWMHTVIAPSCTGCELCLPPCPVDCIDLVAVDTPSTGPWPEYRADEAASWRARNEARIARLARGRGGRASRSGRVRETAPLADTPPPNQIRKEIREAIERVRRKRGSRGASDRG